MHKFKLKGQIIMAPKVKFQKEEIVDVAYNVACEKGIDAVTAREVAARLGVSTRPIFTYFDTIEQLKCEVFEKSKLRYREHIKNGLSAPVPFLGVGREYIRFAKEEPEIYKLLFLTPPGSITGGALEAFKFSRELVTDSIKTIYNMNDLQAECYYRDLWLVVFSFATLIVTDDCPYSDEEMSAILSEVSLSLCKAFKEIPGLPEGDYDKDAIFRKLVKK